MLPPSAWSIAGRPFEAPPERHPVDARFTRVSRRSTMTTTEEPAMTIRRAHPDGSARLAALAALDSARPLRGDDLLLAEGNGAPIAALDVLTGRSSADPMAHSDQAVDLLRLRAEQLRGAASGPRFRR